MRLSDSSRISSFTEKHTIYMKILKKYEFKRFASIIIAFMIHEEMKLLEDFSFIDFFHFFFFAKNFLSLLWLWVITFLLFFADWFLQVKHLFSVQRKWREFSVTFSHTQHLYRKVLWESISLYSLLFVNSCSYISTKLFMHIISSRL